MAWTAPKTWVASTVLTAAELNTHLRDNLNETLPGKATNAGSLFVSDALNSISERPLAGARVFTPETTTSTSFTDLATSGPSVTLQTGVTAIVMTHCRMANSSANTGSLMSWAISGATTRSALDDTATEAKAAANEHQHLSAVDRLTTLTPGLNTFTAKYRVTAGTGTFTDRFIMVLPL